MARRRQSMMAHLEGSLGDLEPGSDESVIDVEDRVISERSGMHLKEYARTIDF